jgi:predicted nucleotidyltransferase component of viral defense system
MMPLQLRLKKSAQQQDVKFEIIEQDYLLSWLLFGIAKHHILSKILVFKGGTALKKCYFGDYRFSQDLDFTLVDDAGYENLNLYVQEACEIARLELDRLGEKCEIAFKEFQEGKPHPHGQKAYVLFAQLYWHRQPMVKIKIEITRDELIINPANTCKIIHTYDEPLDAEIQVYSLEEIIMEKLRAIAQKIIKLHEKGWGRSRARDIYDIWMIYNKYHDSIDNEKIKDNISKKFTIKGIEFKSIDDFFDPAYIRVVTDEWDQWLKPFVKDLPPSEVVLGDVRDRILPRMFKL